MILFLGTRLRTRRLGTGVFHCPFCFVSRTYDHLETRTWVHVFWLPVLPLGSARPVVQCTVCHGQWAPAVLETHPPS